jgi:molybdopterin adenylyltransferase
MSMLRFGLITISDRSARGERLDASGPALEEIIVKHSWEVILKQILPDDQMSIQILLENWVDNGNIDIILTTGGTGFSPRDITPEATKAVITRLAPGLVEAMRSASLAITPHAMLSRAVAGIRNKTLIVNLPGSPNAAIENLNVIVPVLEHAVQLLKDDPAGESNHR